MPVFRTVGSVFLLGLICVLNSQAQTGTGVEPSEEFRASIDAVPEVRTQGTPVSVSSQASLLRLFRFNGTARGQFGQQQSGVIGITFALYYEQKGGSPLWLETQNVELDQQGRYTVLLGATEAEGLPLELFSSGEARWLGIQVQGQPEQSRILLVSVPYALRAEEAQRLAGREASEFLLAEQLENDVQQVVETKVVEELESQGLAATEEGVTRAIVDGASTFTDNNTTQVVQVTQNGTGKAVKATSTTGNTIEAESTGTSGTNFTLLGINRSTGGRALFGFASATSGATIAAAGRADSPLGIGFFGQALSTTGPTVAVQGEVRSPNGIAGLFANTAGGTLLLGKSAGQEVFRVDGGGNVGLPDTTSGAEGVLTKGGVRFLHNFGANNTFVGAGAGNFSMTGNTNAAFGASAFNANTTGSSNAAFGQNALAANTTGGSNSGFGRNALLFNTAGNGNSAFGTSALQNNTASNNSAFGASALASNITGHYNSAFGSLALQSNTAWENSAFGRNAMRDNTTGDRNAAFGTDALRFNITGAGNAAFGAFALQNNTASNNSAFGRDALLANTTGFQNSAFGVNALTANTTGFSNTAVGSNALVSLNPGNSNIALGDSAGSNLTGGDNNIYIGSVGPGVPGSESGIIRIGSVGTHTTTHLVGTVNAPAFVGDGSGLTGLSAAALADGSVTEAKLAFDPATQAELDAEAALRVAGDAAVQADLNTHKSSDDHAATYVNVSGDDINGTLRTINDNATSFRLRGTCDGTVDDDVFDSDCQSYAGVFYNSVFNDTGGTGARTTRTIYGSNEDMDLEIQGSNHVRITAIDNNVGNGRIRLAAEDEIQFHTYPTPGGSNAETDSLDMTVSDGQVTIGGDLDVSGTITAPTITETSSLRWKTNIATLENALATVEQLRGVSYDRLADNQPQIGVIAEEVEEVLPEVVAFDEGGQASGVDYSRLTALLIEAVKEQQGQIRELRKELASVKAGLSRSQKIHLSVSRPSE